MPDVDPEAQNRVATLQGENGSEAQFLATRDRTKEIINLRFDLFRFISGEKVMIRGAQESLIAGTE
jgi:hypothetical protein